MKGDNICHYNYYYAPSPSWMDCNHNDCTKTLHPVLVCLTNQSRIWKSRIKKYICGLVAFVGIWNSVYHIKNQHENNNVRKCPKCTTTYPPLYSCHNNNIAPLLKLRFMHPFRQTPSSLLTLIPIRLSILMTTKIICELYIVANILK